MENNLWQLNYIKFYFSIQLKTIIELKNQMFKPNIYILYHFKDVIRLGKLALKYCRECNLPLLKGKCSCGNDASTVKITPPGDIRPAFEFDKELIKKIVRNQFGDAWLPEVVLLNSTPAIDRDDEVIIDGKVAGNLYYDIYSKKFKFHPRPWYASLLKIRRRYVIADSGALESILKTSNLMSPGVKETDEEIKEGDDVIVLNEDSQVIATGKARMKGEEMGKSKGMAVKIKWRGIEHPEKGKKITWNRVIKENKGVIDSMVGSEKKFIENVIEKYNIPYAVSFSGGKDSLATLLLLLSAGYEPPLLFLNTGLEFDETIENVYYISDKFNLNLIEGKAGNKFWDSIDFFGIPARDYRWCCKTCKLGVASLLIKENFKNGVLSFIGQRRYESQSRAMHGKIWKNPWVNGQIGVSPIQNWTALHIWLYLFMEKVKWNVLYEEGLSRIGCWLCPASDLAEFELKKHYKWKVFEKKLYEFSKKHNLPDEWINLGLWRWRKPPKWSGVNYKIERKEKHVKMDMERIENFLKLIGRVERIKKNVYNVGGTKIEIDEKIKAERDEKIFNEIMERALNCVGCGVCISKCSQNAIYIKNGKAWIGDGCIKCLECMYECPVLIFK